MTGFEGIVLWAAAVLAGDAPAAEEYLFAIPPSDVAVVGRYAYTPVAWRVEKNWTDTAYLAVFDLQAKRPVTRLALAGIPRSLTRLGPLLVCSTGAELVVISIQKPQAPEILSRTMVSDDPLCAAERVRAAGDLLFCAAGKKGLLVFTLDGAGKLTQVASYRGPQWGTSYGVAIDGPRIAVADMLGLALLTYSRQGEAVSLVPRGYLVLPHASKCVAIEGDTAVVGGSVFAMQIVNIADLARPVLAGSYQRETNYYGVSFFDVILKDGLAHVPMGEYAYIAVDVSNPRLPKMVIEYKPLRDKPNWTRYAMEIYYIGIALDPAAKRVYLASERNLEVVDISDVKRPSRIAWVTP